MLKIGSVGGSVDKEASKEEKVCRLLGGANFVR